MAAAATLTRSMPAESPPPPSRAPLVLALAVGTLAVSTAAPLIRLAEMPAIAIAAWRTLLCGAVYAAARPGQVLAILRTPRRDLGRMLAAAALLAAHFALWISAFEHTSYASAVLLLVTQPVFGALIGGTVLRERGGVPTAIATVGSGAGLVLVVLADLDEPGGLLGDALAVAGSLAIALFFLVVRPVRDRLPFAPFMAVTYGAAGLLLATLALATGVPLSGHPPESWAAIALLAIVPTVVGHACFNWVAHRVRFFTLNLVVVLEPALAILLGAWLLDEGVTPEQAAGGAVLGLAVLIGLRRPAGAGRVARRSSGAAGGNGSETTR